MSRFPLLKDLSGKRVLIVGGGEVALRRARILRDFGAEVRIVAPEFIEGFDGFECIRRKFDPGDVCMSSLVVAATDRSEINARIAEICLQQGIEVNVCDDPAAGSFQFPALVQKGGVTVGISTAGASPVAAKYIREQIEQAIPDNFEEILSCMSAAKAIAKAILPGQKDRAAALRRVFSYCLNAEKMPDEQALARMIAEMD